MARRLQATRVFADPSHEGVPVEVELDTDAFRATETNISAILASAAVLHDARKVEPPIMLQTPDGARVAVARDEDGAWWMDAPRVEFLNAAQPAFAARSLCLDADDVDWQPFPQAVAVGATRRTLVVPVLTAPALARARVDLLRFRRLLPRVDGDSILAFTRAAAGELRARCFPAQEGAPEAVADAEAVAALAAWLADTSDLGPAPSVAASITMGPPDGPLARVRVRARRVAPGRVEARVGGVVMLSTA